MRRGLVIRSLLVLLVVLAAACSSGGSDDAGGSSPTNAVTTPTGSDDAGSDDGSDGGSDGGGKVDCEALQEAQQQLLGVQLLAQLDDPETVASIKAKSIGNLDLDAFLAAMETLHALDGFDSPLGDPKASIDAYEAAAEEAQTLFDADPPTQEAIDAYHESIGPVPAFLSKQTAIAGGFDAAGC
jgi:hypothetical protein